MRYLLAVVLPFLIAFITALALRRPSLRLSHGNARRMKGIRVMMVVLLLTAALLVVTAAVIALVRQLKDLLASFSESEGALISELGNMLDKASLFLSELPFFRHENEAQVFYDMIAEHKRDRVKADNDLELAKRQAEADIELKMQEAYASRIKEIFAAISPDLVAAMTSTANADLMTAVTKNMSPLAIAKGESVADTTNLLLRGTPLESMLKNFAEKQ